jgi:hypothetical protein
VSVPPVSIYTRRGDEGVEEEVNAINRRPMREHIAFIKELHASSLRGSDDLSEDSDELRNRTFFEIISNSAEEYIIFRNSDLNLNYEVEAERRIIDEICKKLDDWLVEASRLHNAVIQCLPKIKNQLMGEQISRQTTLHPDVMKNIMEFANAKDPKRIVLDSAANRGVALPRAGRRTRRTKRRGTFRARRR